MSDIKKKDIKIMHMVKKQILKQNGKAHKENIKRYLIYPKQDVLETARSTYNNGIYWKQPLIKRKKKQSQMAKR